MLNLHELLMLTLIRYVEDVVRHLSDRLVPINTFINFSLSQKTLKPASANVKTAK